MENQKLPQLQEWIKVIVSAIVSFPEDVEVSHIEDSMGILFSVMVNAEDKGKVIGKEGKVANAIRTLVRSAGYVMNCRVSVKIDAGTGFALEKEDR